MKSRVTTKRFMTLFEVLISLSLLVVLLAILFGFFRELSVVNAESKKNLKESFQSRYAENRLFYVFSNLVNENDTKRSFYFYTAKDETSKFPSLIFTFDNGSVLDPYLAGDVLGRLFVDQDNRLCLAVAALKSEKGQTEQELQAHIKLESLMEDVQNISFQFLTPFIIEKSTKEDQKDPPKGEWLPEWDKAYKQKPIIVKVVVEKSKTSKLDKNSSRVFSFVLPSSKNPIIFKAKE